MSIPQDSQFSGGVNPSPSQEVTGGQNHASSKISNHSGHSFDDWTLVPKGEKQVIANEGQETKKERGLSTMEKVCIVFLLIPVTGGLSFLVGLGMLAHSLYDKLKNRKIKPNVSPNPLPAAITTKMNFKPNTSQDFEGITDRVK